jgi:hypothetical protein
VYPSARSRSGATRLPEGASFQPMFDKMEREANQFAAELLMPDPSCRSLVDELSPRFSRGCMF